MLDRAKMLEQLLPNTLWDILVIGGGATGLGVAVDAASRGYATVLVERYDFGTGTSSRSTKLAHGGVRYLRQGQVGLVKEALHERGLMRRNAPHLVHHLGFILPTYGWRDRLLYGIGLTAYDLLAGRLGFGRSRWLSPAHIQEYMPTVNMTGVTGGILYHDGQFDDARLLINLAQTAAEHGAVLVNYMPVTALRMAHGRVCGVLARDDETAQEYDLQAKVVINATGVFSDAMRRLDTPRAAPLIQPSQGVHLVLDPSCFPGTHALMLPHTDDGRVLFAIPWHGCVLVGTTDTPIEETLVEPRPQPEEMMFLLEHIRRYLTASIDLCDIRSVFAGLRPLVAGQGRTARLSREHTIVISDTGLLSVLGGKWTTYRRMAETAVDRAITLAALPFHPCITQSLPIHGAPGHATSAEEFSQYGTDANSIDTLTKEQPDLHTRLHPDHPYRVAEVVWAVRYEMARTVEDILARRLRALFCDARASIHMAPKVAAILAAELHRDTAWKHQQIQAFQSLAQTYLPETKITPTDPTALSTPRNCSTTTHLSPRE